MLCHDEFSNHQIPTFLIKILDKSDLMERTHGAKNTVITKENNWHHFGFASQFTYFSDSKKIEMLLSFMITAVVQNFVTCYDIF
jgi:hypothetical protein